MDDMDFHQSLHISKGAEQNVKVLVCQFHFFLHLELMNKKVDRLACRLLTLQVVVDKEEAKEKGMIPPVGNCCHC